MSNFTPGHQQTGVGHTLKKLYVYYHVVGGLDIVSPVRETMSASPPTSSQLPPPPPPPPRGKSWST
eukprot:830211-Prorocentrum_minimum.AAC.1